MEEATIARDYTWPVKITTFDAGQDQRLTPAGQLRLQQETFLLGMVRKFTFSIFSPPR